MNHQNPKSRLIYSIFVAILAIVVMSTSETVVSSQHGSLDRPLPFEFKALAAPKGVVTRTAAAPDNGFKWTTDFNSSEQVSAVAVQQDGKIVAVGTTTIVGGDTNLPGGGSSYAGYDLAVFRYNADGSLDNSFDGDGKATASLGGDFGSNELANAAAIQPDGKIIAAGSVGEHFALVRFNTDGTPDTLFGTDGKVITQTGSGGIRQIALQADGKIVAAGGRVSIVRYNGDGSLDNSFGTGGIIQLGTQMAASEVAVQPNGRIVVAGSDQECIDQGDFEPPLCYDIFSLVRYNANGSHDISFNRNGLPGAATALAIQTDGKIVTATGGNGFSLARHNPDGSLDDSFDGDGIVRINNDGYAETVVIQSDGKIVVSGPGSGTNPDFTLARLNADGSLDTSFDFDGKLATDFGSSEDATSISIQPDGKIVAAGYSGEDGYGFDAFDFALSRYNADGSLDASFDNDGKLTTSYHDGTSAATAVVVGFGYQSFLVGYANNGKNDDFAVCSDGNGTGFIGRMITSIGNGDDRANAATRVPNNKVVAVGYSDNGSNKDFALVRYHHYAHIDASFGTNGKVTTDFGGNDEATAIAVQWDGKVVVTGKTSSGSGAAAIVLARYNDDGSLDQTFGTGGRVIVPAIQNAKAVAIQTGGKIVAGGSSPHTVSPFGDNFAVARFHLDGSLDTSFDADGIAFARFDHTSQVNSVSLDGTKIVAAGLTRNSSGSFSRFALARFNPNGSPDTSFDVDGKVITSFAGSSEASAVQLLSNGKIVVAGSSVNSPTGRDFALARFNGDGSPDETFDTDGKQTIDFFAEDDDAFAVAITYNNMIVAAGAVRRGARSRFAEVLHYGGDSPALTPPPVLFDFDGDRRSDISVFRPSNGRWYLQRSSDGYAEMPWGEGTDKITPADYTGDGRTDLSVFRESNGTWLNYQLSMYEPLPIVSWGQQGDLRVPADYDGDGIADIAVWRPSQGTWYILQSANGWRFQQWGSPGDRPAPADFDGDGQIDLAVFRPSEGKWYVANFATGEIAVIGWGVDGDIPVPGDYSGDGLADYAVYRPSNNTWYRLHSNDYSIHAQTWGAQDDIPTPGDYDGDGRMDLAVFRPSEGKWYVLTATNNIFTSQFGQDGDIPTPSAFVN